MSERMRSEYMEVSSWKTAGFSAEGFTGLGALLVALVGLVPVWDAVLMLRSVNFRYWLGTALPWALVAACVGTLCAVVLASALFFSLSRPGRDAPQRLAMLASLFATVLGISMVLISVPMSEGSMRAYGNLMYECGTNEATRRTYEAYRVLLNIRQAPGCMEVESVEMCPGYQAGGPYVEYLKGMEGHFRCTGFCYTPPQGNTTVAALFAVGPGHLARHQQESTPPALETGDAADQRPALMKAAPGLWAKRRGRAAPGRLLPTAAESTPPQLLALRNAQPATATSLPPPTLFSRANFVTSCDGAAARDMQSFARDIAYQLWQMGIALIALSVAIGAWEWKNLVIHGQ